MTDHGSTVPAPNGLRFALAAVVTFVPMTFVIVVVNYWIYYARVEFSALHPEYLAEDGPPTISRAISDPAIGDPFAFWIGLSALMLVIGVLPICRLYWSAGRNLPSTGKMTRKLLMFMAVSAVVLEIVTAIGMVMLSHYRFPDHNFLHMIGSYVFFVAQAVVVLLVGITCLRVSTDREAVAFLTGRAMINPRMSRFRAPMAFGGVVLGVTFLTLFFVKDVDFGAANTVIYQAYVWSEPSLISYFLAIFATYYLELYAALRSPVVAPGRLVAASQTPD